MQLSSIRIGQRGTCGLNSFFENFSCLFVVVQFEFSLAEGEPGLQTLWTGGNRLSQPLLGLASVVMTGFYEAEKIEAGVVLGIESQFRFEKLAGFLIMFGPL